MDTFKCFGCGATLQNTDDKKPGYVPLKVIDHDGILCQRCFKLTHYHQNLESHMSDRDYLTILDQISETNALVVYIVDLFDFNGSLIPGIMRHINYNDTLVLANKRDLLPKSLNDNRIENWVRHQLNLEGVKVKDVIITSAKKAYQFDTIFDAIDEIRRGRDVYVVGMSNVGKSTFINALLKHYSDETRAITVSEFPGTTLDLIRIPFDEQSSLYDTPGIINAHSMTQIVDDQQLKLLIPQVEIRPITYQLNSSQSLYFEGFARFDYLKGEKKGINCYISKRIKIHRCKLEKADALYNNHQQLKETIDQIETIDQMKTIQFTIKSGKKEIAIAGLGFISLKGPATIAIKVPRSVDVIIRDCLI
ncbi:MAG: ribosome biogenesis GTPase YqeH [Erysipelotrichaceae bacterium]|nr:ribosome biogenesis GTPase YqeH [Erysipelotrichaceae bacterium]